jgi:hypothetical protein
MSESRPPKKPSFLAEIRFLFETNKWPGWATVLLAFVIFIPDWQGRLSFWLDALSKVGGAAAVMVDILSSRYIPMGLFTFGSLYIVAVVLQEESDRARQWMPLAGWTVILVFGTIFSALALFLVFVSTSNIPSAMEYLANAGVERRVTGQQAERLKDELQKVSNQIPIFALIAARNEESLQFATDLLNVMKSSGLKIANRDGGQQSPEPVDLFSTSHRGILIGVEFADAPPRSAILLSQALKKVNLESSYIPVANAAPASLLVIVGPK